MAASLILTLNDGTGRSSTDLSQLVQPSDELAPEANALINYLSSYASGAGGGSITVSLSGSALVAATGTVTCASVQAADTVTINGVVFTATGDVAPANYFNIGADDDETAAALVTSINASETALVEGFITASAAADVVLLTANPKGVVGNAYTLASSNGSRLAVSDARLEGGTGGLGSSTTQYDYGV